MGLFDIILKGLGFENDDNEHTQKEKKEKKQKPIEGAKFDLTKVLPEEPVVAMPKFEEPQIVKTQSSVLPSASSKSGMVQSPRSQSDIQEIVELLRKREAVIVNFSALSQRDAERGLDFLSGAVYAMRGTVEKLEGNLFLLTPQPKQN
ncbi:MAG: cell division protein SepF [Clostridia bacterium]